MITESHKEFETLQELVGRLTIEDLQFVSKKVGAKHVYNVLLELKLLELHNYKAKKEMVEVLGDEE